MSLHIPTRRFKWAQYCLIAALLILTTPGLGQTTHSGEEESPPFFKASEAFSKKRFSAAAGFGLATYTGFSIGLYKAWYADYPKSKFHTFNDWGEWQNMDKAGHIFSGYFQSLLTYKGCRWAGVQKKPAIWLGVATATLFQSTVEVMDGFSTEWGFSVPDVIANGAGISIFALQQNFWDEQRILVKESAWPVSHPSDVYIMGSRGVSRMSLKERAAALYGDGLGEKLLKDYNAQTYWASINVKSFLPDHFRFPGWLNLAIGYGANNLYGGFENQWEVGNISYGASHIERQHKIVLALDADLSRIPTDNHFLKTLFSIGNLVKLPSPAIEYNSSGEFIFHLVYF